MTGSIENKLLSYKQYTNDYEVIAIAIRKYWEWKVVKKINNLLVQFFFTFKV